MEKVLTSADFDENTGKYKLILTTADTNIPPGRHFFDCVLVDSSGEKHRLSSGRVIVKESYV